MEDEDTCYFGYPDEETEEPLVLFPSLAPLNTPRSEEENTHCTQEGAISVIEDLKESEEHLGEFEEAETGRLEDEEETKETEEDAESKGPLSFHYKDIVQVSLEELTDYFLQSLEDIVMEVYPEMVGSERLRQLSFLRAKSLHQYCRVLLEAEEEERGRREVIAASLYPEEIERLTMKFEEDRVARRRYLRRMKKEQDVCCCVSHFYFTHVLSFSHTATPCQGHEWLRRRPAR